MRATVEELTRCNPEAIEDLQDTAGAFVTNTLFMSLYSDALRQDVKYGKPYRHVGYENFSITANERLRWNQNAEERIRPKYHTWRSMDRLEKGEQIIKLTKEGYSIPELKIAVGTGKENIAQFRRRAGRK